MAKREDKESKGAFPWGETDRRLLPMEYVIPEDHIDLPPEGRWEVGDQGPLHLSYEVVSRVSELNEEMREIQLFESEAARLRARKAMKRRSRIAKENIRREIEEKERLEKWRKAYASYKKQLLREKEICELLLAAGKFYTFTKRLDRARKRFIESPWGRRFSDEGIQRVFLLETVQCMAEELHKRLNLGVEIPGFLLPWTIIFSSTTALLECRCGAVYRVPFRVPCIQFIDAALYMAELHTQCVTFPSTPPIHAREIELIKEDRPRDLPWTEFKEISVR